MDPTSSLATRISLGQGMTEAVAKTKRDLAAQPVTQHSFETASGIGGGKSADANSAVGSKRSRHDARGY